MVKKEKGKGREIIYSITSETKKEIELKIQNQLQSYDYLSSFLGGGNQKREKNIN